MLTEGTVVERWFFYQDAAGLWKWARLDILGTILAHSGASFGSRSECVENARHAGYEDERPVMGLGVTQDRSAHGNLTRGSRF